MPELVSISQVSHRYGQRQALQGVSFTVEESQIFGLLGPNGSGKSTLFRILSTLIPLTEGNVTVAGADLRTQLPKVRRQLGVVFQSPSLDKKLSVRENLLHQGHLYGLHGPDLAARIQELLARFSLSERVAERVETLSGGLQRRVELAKSLLHRPRILLLDEPSTGLDPNARRELWDYLREVRSRDGVTILVTTHLMDEAELCDRLVILDQGRVVVQDTPAALKGILAGTILTVTGKEPESLRGDIQEKIGGTPVVIGSSIRLECSTVAGDLKPTEILSRLTDLFGSRLSAITLAQPNLEDVFIHLTGRHFDESNPHA